MDGILSDKIKKWVKEFSTSSLDRDGYHIDELFESDCPKGKWIDYAWECYHQAISECSKFDNIQVILTFYLNTTLSARPHPKAISRQLFNTIDTPPEIFLIKNIESDYFSNDVLLEELGDLYSMHCYYLEETDESDNTYWHYLYFTN